MEAFELLPAPRQGSESKPVSQSVRDGGDECYSEVSEECKDGDPYYIDIEFIGLPS